MKVYGLLLPAYIASLSGGLPFGVCNDAADVVEKTGECPDFQTLNTGAVVLMKFMHNNTATFPRINVNGTGLKYIVNVGRTAVGTNYWRPEQTVILIYDGIFWVALTTPLADTSYFGITKLSTSTSSTSTSTAATSSAVKPPTTGTPGLPFRSPVPWPSPPVVPAHPMPLPPGRISGLPQPPSTAAQSRRVARPFRRATTFSSLSASPALLLRGAHWSCLPPSSLRQPPTTRLRTRAITTLSSFTTQARP